jgi:uncharacterized Ntn-hydrolase superfamily protein
LAMATVLLAVGGLCLWFTSNGNVISSQAYASKRDGELMYRAMEEGKSAPVALAVLTGCGKTPERSSILRVSGRRSGLRGLRER